MHIQCIDFSLESISYAQSMYWFCFERINHAQWKKYMQVAMIMHSSCTDVLRQPCTVHAQKVNAKHEFREEFMGEKERLIVDKENISQKKKIATSVASWNW